MRILLALLAVAMACPVAARADDLAGSLVLHVTETPVAPAEGVLNRDDIIAIHELQADRGAVLLEHAARGMASSPAGAVLIAIRSGGRAHLYCDIRSRRALTGGFITCFEDQDADGRLETRYLASTRMEIPSMFLMLAGADSIEPAAYREAEAHERPIVKLGFDPCAIGRRTTFKLVVSTEPDAWSGGASASCQSAEQVLQNLGVGFAIENSESGVSYRLTQPLAAGAEVLLFPNLR